MAFMDMFKSAPDTAVQPAAPAQPAPEVNNAGTQTPAPQNDKMPGSDQTPPNPLDAYANMFKDSSNPEAPPAFSLDPAVLDKVTSGLDFAKGVPAELMQKAQAGDMNAMFQAMNLMAQNAYKTGLQHTSTLTDRFVQARSAHDSKGLGTAVRSELTTNALSATPNYNHPVVKQQLNRIAADLQKANPDASPQEIAKSAQQFLLEVAKAVNPEFGTAPAPANQAPGADTDWTKYLE